MNQLPADYSEQVALARERMAGFKASHAYDALAREDALPDALASVNASAKSKLRRIYAMSAYFSDRGRLFQTDRGRCFSAIVDAQGCAQARN